MARLIHSAHTNTFDAKPHSFGSSFQWLSVGVSFVVFGQKLTDSLQITDFDFANFGLALLLEAMSPLLLRPQPLLRALSCSEFNDRSAHHLRFERKAL